MIMNFDLRGITDSKLVEKCHELVFNHGVNEQTSNGLQKRFIFLGEKLYITFSGDWGGGCGLSVYHKTVSNNVLFCTGVTRDSRDYNRWRKEGFADLEVGNIVYNLRSYKNGEWEQRVHDVYHGIELAREKRNLLHSQ